jgi:hypothetical protein
MIMPDPSDSLPDPEPKPQPIVAVEYLIKEISLPIENELVVALCNALGQEGWRLLFTSAENGLRLWFMREVQ